MARRDLIADLTVLPVERWPLSPLLPRMWELRDNLTPYEAAYVALAELTAAVLVTGDERMRVDRRRGGHHVQLLAVIVRT